MLSSKDVRNVAWDYSWLSFASVGYEGGAVRGKRVMVMVVRGGVGSDCYARPRISIHRSSKLIHDCMIHMGISC